MPKKLPAQGQKKWFLHLLAFLIVNAVLWYICYAGKENEPFVYPWPIWITTAWFLLVVGHACMIWYNYDDPNYEEWVKQTKE